MSDERERSGAGGVSQAAVRDTCTGEVCVTCSDTAVQCQVIELLDDDLALVTTPGGAAEEVSVAFVNAAVGDTVLVHAGEAIAAVPGEAVPG